MLKTTTPPMTHLPQPLPRAGSAARSAHPAPSVPGPVLVAVGTDELAGELLRAAHERARVAGVPLVVCHVLPAPARYEPLFPRHHSQRVLDALELEGSARQALTERIERVTGRTRKEYTLVFPRGTVPGGILALADAIEPGLVVVGPGNASTVVGLHARHDTLVLRPSPKGVVLGATDLTDPSLPALKAAVREARLGERPLCFFHSVKPPRAATPAFPFMLQALPVTPLEAEELQATTDSARELLVDYARQVQDGARVEVQVVQGWPVKEITRQTQLRPVELVVVATRARPGLEGLLHWSVMQEMLEHIPCSFLVVKHAR